jgi:hypothetical protein
MFEYKIIFAKGIGPTSDSEVGTTWRLSAANTEEAESRARKLPPPEGADRFKIVREGRVLETHWLPLDAPGT